MPSEVFLTKNQKLRTKNQELKTMNYELKTMNQLNSRSPTPSGQANPTKRYIAARPPSSRKDLN